MPIVYENPLSLRRDAGALYESYVFNALTRDRSVTNSLYFYRTQSKSEIDFIQVEDAHYSLYEVKAGKNQRILRAVLEFIKKYKDQLSIEKQSVINQSEYFIKSDVMFLPAYLL